MLDATQVAVLGTAAATGVLHSLIPDHWLPFVLVGRARGWNSRNVAAISGLSGLIHAGLSLALGAAAVAVGAGAAEAFGENLERAGSILLIVFGVVYALWSWRKGGHFHPGGARIHGPEPKPCTGQEGDSNPEHLHYHADQFVIGRPGWGAVGLALIVGLNPCVLMMPVLLAGVSMGLTTVALAALSYSVPAILLTVGLSVMGVRMTNMLSVPGAARYMEAGSGILIAMLGVVFWVLH